MPAPSEYIMIFMIHDIQGAGTSLLLHYFNAPVNLKISENMESHDNVIECRTPGVTMGYYPPQISR